MLEKDEGKNKYGYKGQKAAKPAAAIFKVGQEELEDYHFVYSRLKSKKWIILREKYITYAEKNWRQGKGVAETGKQNHYSCKWMDHTRYSEIEKVWHCFKWN